MKKIILSLFVLIFMISCDSAQKNTTGQSEKIIFQKKDKEILEEILKLSSDDQEKPASELIIKVGTFFKETPYVAHTLETDSTEQLVVNLREMDCTTFAENCLAITQTIQSGELTFNEFAKELKRIRYRDGQINGYASRLHYFSDWIYNNKGKMLVKDFSEEMSLAHYAKEINFMSTHPESYQQLAADSTLIQVIAKQEKEFSQRSMYYIPEDRISEIEGKFMDGDIAGITTSIEGLDISHVIILIHVDGRIHLMHASSMAAKVIISEETLEEYLLNSKSATGIMVARPL